MSPKKAVIKNPSKIKIPEKMPKRTVKKEKPKLNNMPANLKVSIPLAKTSEEGVYIPVVRGRRPPQFKKKLDLNTKVELANSVARLQLGKEVSRKEELEAENFIITHPKRGRKKKVPVVSDFFQTRVVIENNTNGVVSSTGDSVPVKKPAVPTRRIVTRKRLADSTAQTAAKRQKKSSTENLIANIKIEENANDDSQDTPDSNQFVEPVVQPSPEVEQPLLTIRKTKPTVRRAPAARKPRPAAKQGVPGRKRAPRGKKDPTGDNSPSILDHFNKLPKKETEVEVKSLHAPGLVDSRKTSVSSNSNLSWTKDISSSSATTCVTVASNDFVRFNKKFPIVKLTNIDSEVKRRQIEKEVTASAEADEASDDSSDSSESECTDCGNKYSERLPDSIDVNSLNLSTSSPPSTRTQTRNKETNKDYSKTAERLSLTMKKIDMEIINWISSDNEDVNANLAKFKDKMFDILDNEFGVITHCRHLKEILDPPKIDVVQKDIVDAPSVSEPVHNDNDNDVVKEVAPVEGVAKEVEFVKPRPFRKLSGMSDGNVSNDSTRVTRDENSEDETTTGAKNYQYYDNHDDDDALSLFAESITGFESSRMNTSIASAPVTHARPVEEYVPQPVKEDCAVNTEKHTYNPTRIREDAETLASRIKIICEKQSADSTSIYKQSNSTDDAESYQDFNENTDLDTRLAPPEIKKPRLMDSYFEGMPKSRSVVFGNLCFYNLMNCCRKNFFGHCRFVHAIPSCAQIKLKLGALDDMKLIQEYLLLRNWAELRRKFGMCYVEEAAKRGLTKILVEMAYDFIVKARNESEEDTRLRVDTIEITLLHLNTVDLSECEDLLKMPIRSDRANRTLLCDVFMATMSITQNFSRFKIVFLNLTYFMVDNDRTFNKDVVEHILERVCILPFEEPIARALIQMMRLTNSDIFKNSMIGHFEKQISANKDVFEEYSLLKTQCAFTSMLASSVVSPSPPLKVDQPLSVRPDGGDGQPPAPSPDTTNLDSMNKPTDEPTNPAIMRTIGMNPPIFKRAPESPVPDQAHESSDLNRVHESSSLNRGHENPGSSRTHTSSGSSTSDDTVNQNIGKWRNRAIYPHLRPPPSAERSMMRAPVRTPLRPPMRPHLRPPLRMPFNQRLVTFRSPTNFTVRQSGPKY